jgi:hypothetical protein
MEILHNKVKYELKNKIKEANHTGNQTCTPKKEQGIRFHLKKVQEKFIFFYTDRIFFSKLNLFLVILFLFALLCCFQFCIIFSILDNQILEVFKTVNNINSSF